MGRNPFCQDFEYGTSAEVYFNYYQMIIQPEDCTIILKDTHPDIYFIFIFDHTWGHDRVIEDRLDLMKMNSGHGGSQREMNPTNIK